MADSIDYRPNGNAATFSGAGAVAVYQMAVMASGLRLYARTGLKPNRAYTPKAMLETAGALLGWDAVTIRRAIRARDYLGTADALTAKVQTEKTRIAAESADRAAGVTGAMIGAVRCSSCQRHTFDPIGALCSACAGGDRCEHGYAQGCRACNPDGAR